MYRLAVILSALITGLFSFVILLLGLANAADVGLQWNVVSNADGYNVYHRLTDGAYVKGSPAETVTQATYTFEDMDEGMTHYFVVTAFNDWGESGYSSEVGVYILSDAEQQAEQPIIPGDVKSTSTTYHLDNGSTVVVITP